MKEYVSPYDIGIILFMYFIFVDVFDTLADFGTYSFCSYRKISYAAICILLLPCLC